MVGNGGIGTDKGRIRGAGTGDNVQGGGSDGVAVWEWYMGGDGRDVDGSRGFYHQVYSQIYDNTARRAGKG